MLALRWLWVAALILGGTISEAAWPGWLILLVGIFAICPWFWDRLEANGYETHETARKVTAIVVSLIAVMGVWSRLSYNALTADIEATSADVNQLVATIKTTDSERQWQYKRGRDEMRGTKWWSASIYAAEKATLGFPYAGGTPARILLRQSSDEGPFNQQATLVLENGQIDCSSCRVSFKFDDGPIFESITQKVDCGGADCITLNVHKEGTYDSDKMNFAEHLMHASKLTIEVPIYQYGYYQYHFDTKGLVWPQPGAPTKD